MKGELKFLGILLLVMLGLIVMFPACLRSCADNVDGTFEAIWAFQDFKDDHLTARHPRKDIIIEETINLTKDLKAFLNNAPDKENAKKYYYDNIYTLLEKYNFGWPSDFNRDLDYINAYVYHRDEIERYDLVSLKLYDVVKEGYYYFNDPSDLQARISIQNVSKSQIRQIKKGLKDIEGVKVSKDLEYGSSYQIYIIVDKTK